MRREGIARVLGLAVGDVDIQTIPADGDCLFASLSSALAQHKNVVGYSIRELRSMVAQEVGEEQARRQCFPAITRPQFRCQSLRDRAHILEMPLIDSNFHCAAARVQHMHPTP